MNFSAYGLVYMLEKSSLTTTGCFQCFLIPCKCPFPTTATTELFSLAILSNVDDMYLETQEDQPPQKSKQTRQSYRKY